LEDLCSRVFDHSLKYDLGTTTVNTDKNIIAFSYMGTDFYYNLRDNYKSDFCMSPNASKLEIEFIQQLNSKIPEKYLPTKIGEVCGSDACVNPDFTRLGLLKHSWIHFLRKVKEKKYKYFVTRSISKGTLKFAEKVGATKVGYINLTEFTTAEGIKPFKDAAKLYEGQQFDNEICVTVLDIQNTDIDYLDKYL